jgi:hypothetical protein
MFINLTQHNIEIETINETMKIPASGSVMRVRSKLVWRKSIDGVPTRSIARSVPGMPEPKDGVIYITSSMVRHALHWRDDVASPSLKLDSRGKVVACDGLIMNGVEDE